VNGHRLAVAAVVLAAGCSATAGLRDRDHLGREALADLSARERQALSDKQVTFGEYESANRAQVACLRSLGVTVDEPELSIDGTFTVGWSTSATGADFERLEADAGRCHEDVNAIKAVYVLQHAVSDEERREGEDAFRACANDLGVPDAEDAGFTELLEDLRDRVVSGQIERDPATRCQNLLRAVAVSPLPGLAEALQALEL